MVHLSGFVRILQDCVVFHLDMESLELLVPGEAAPRRLECRMLQPGEHDSNRPMNPEQLEDLFRNGAQQEGNDAEDDQEEDEENQEEHDEAAMEAANVVPDHPVHQHDGGDLEDEMEVDGGELGDSCDFPKFELGTGVPCLPQGIAVGNDGEAPFLEDPDVYSDGEMLIYQAPIPRNARGLVEAEDVGVSSLTASSSEGKQRTYGLHITPSEARSQLPPGAGVKLQHHRSKQEGRCSGWQAWPGELFPSKFFSYGTGGKFADSNAAMQAAVDFCWDI